MRILLTNHELALRTGTELATCELATALVEAGHEAAVFTWKIGPLGQSLAAAGVPVVDRPEAVPFRPDVIHGQHHLAAMAALAAWPDVPGLYHCHGVRPFDEQPPRHPRLLRHLSMANRNAEWIRETIQGGPEAVHTLPNWVDLKRFARVRTAALRPTRAAWFVNRLEAGSETGIVATACAASGMTLDLIGAGFGTGTDSPQNVLPNYDVVLATGRSAIEAMACGCAVVSCEPDRVGPLITPGNLDAMTALNFCVDGCHPRLSVDAVNAVLATYEAPAVSMVTECVRRERSLTAAVAAVLGHYESVRLQHHQGELDDQSESSAWVGYLRFLRERTHECDEAFACARREARQAAARTERAETRLAEAKCVHRGLVDRLRRSWWGRRWLRREPPENSPGT